jgi:hypothetical protein
MKRILNSPREDSRLRIMKKVAIAIRVVARPKTKVKESVIESLEAGGLMLALLVGVIF